MCCVCCVVALDEVNNETKLKQNKNEENYQTNVIMGFENFNYKLS